jgi:hypothetical protein
MKAQNILIGLIGVGIGAYIFNKQKVKKIIADITTDEVETTPVSTDTAPTTTKPSSGGSNIADIPMTTPIKTQNDFGNTPLSFITTVEGSTVSFYRDLTNAYKRFYSTVELGATSPISITQDEYVKAYKDYESKPVVTIVSETITDSTTV